MNIEPKTDKAVKQLVAGYEADYGDYTLRLEITPDTDSSINDYECYGNFQHSPRATHKTCDENQFVLIVGRDTFLWTAPGWYGATEAGGRDKLYLFAERCARIAEEGFYGYIVTAESFNGLEASASLWGIESEDPKANRDIIADLVWQAVNDLDNQVSMAAAVVMP